VVTLKTLSSSMGARRFMGEGCGGQCMAGSWARCKVGS
jgi:hypothetical protein